MFSPNFESLLRNVYILNLNKRNENERTYVHAIDIIETNQLFTSSIRRFFKKQECPDKISSDLKYIKKIKNTPFINNKRKLHFYLKFYNEIKKNESLYLSYLGKSDFIKLNSILKGIEIASYENNIGEKRDFNIRENFIYDNIMNLVDTLDNSNYISINGHVHTPSIKCQDWLVIKDWESLVVKISKHFKTCSIYFMPRSGDLVSDIYFATEREILRQNVPIGEVRLIQTDGENSPFKNIQININTSCSGS